MRLLRLELENFRSHGLLELDLEGIDAAAIVGHNGAGKTSILQSIFFCLYGGSADELLSRSADKGGVTLTLEQGGHRWRINRGRERAKKTWCVVEREEDGTFRPMATRTIAESQTFIEEAITGMDADAFRATVYAPQGEVGVLASLKPGARKALLGGLLGLEDYEEWREQAALDSRGAKSSAESARERLEDLEGRIAEAERRFLLEDLTETCKLITEQLVEDEAELEKAIARQADVEKVERRRQLVTQMQGVKARAAVAKERAEKHTAAKARLGELGDASEDLTAERERKSKHDAAAAQALDSQRAVQRATRGVEDAQSRLRESEELIQKTKDAIAKAEEPGAACPACGQPVEGEHRNKVLTDLREEMGRREEKSPTLQSELEEAQGEARRAAEAAAQSEVGEFDMARLRQLEEQVAERSRLEGQVDALAGGESLEDLKTEWANLKAEAEKLPKEVAEGPKPTEIRERITTNRERKERVEAAIREDAAARKEAAELTEQLSAQREAAEQADLDERAYAVLAKAFSRDGIPAMILDNTVGGIEAATNETLEQLGVDMSIRLVTQRQTKTGNLSETLDILVDDGTTEAPLESFSGGEKARVHIALRLGLASVLTASTGLEVGFLLIDEIPDVDTTGIELLAGLLAQLPQQVLLVSHAEDLIAAMPQRIVVERSAGAQSQVSLQ